MGLSYYTFQHDGSNTGGIPYYGVCQTGWGNNRVLRFYGDGRIDTSKGSVVFDSDIKSMSDTLAKITQGQLTRTSGSDPFAENSWTIQRSYDPSTASGYRYRISGVSVDITDQYHFTVNFPMTLAGIFPGAYGVSTLFVNEDPDPKERYNNSWVALTKAPTTSSMRIVSARANQEWVYYPMRALWWVEGW